MASQLFQRGLAVRREVLGDAYVDKALDGATDLTRPFQELITEYCWGAVWTRPGLPRQTRSLLNIGILSALNRPHELESHMRGAFNNGCSEEEIVEVLLQTAVYCGIPASLDAFGVLKRVKAQHNGAGQE